MKYAELLKKVKLASRDKLITGYRHYFDFYGESFKSYSSFLPDETKITLKQIERLIEDGWIYDDFGTYEIIAKTETLKDHRLDEATILRKPEKFDFYLIRHQIKNQPTYFEKYNPFFDTQDS